MLSHINKIDKQQCYRDRTQSKSDDHYPHIDAINTRTRFWATHLHLKMIIFCYHRMIVIKRLRTKTGSHEIKTGCYYELSVITHPYAFHDRINMITQYRAVTI